jgi:hypothetical protein
MRVEELDVVALTVDRPDLGPKAGHVGTIVLKYDDNNFEVEFVDSEGRTYGLHALPAGQLLKLRHEEAA